MANTMATMGNKTNKGVGNVKKLTKSIPKPTGNQKPGASVSSKAAPKTITKMARMDRLAANQPQTKGAVGGHMSYSGINGRDKG